MRACRDTRGDGEVGTGAGVEGKSVRSMSARAVSAADDVELSRAGNVVGDFDGVSPRCNGASSRRRVRLERNRGVGSAVGLAGAWYIERTGGVVKEVCGVRLRFALEPTDAVSGSSGSLAVV